MPVRTASAFRFTRPVNPDSLSWKKFVAGILIAGILVACSKSHSTPSTQADPPAAAHNYFTDGNWRYAGQRYTDSFYLYHPMLIDTFGFTAGSMLGTNIFEDQVTSYFYGIEEFTSSIFIVTSKPGFPDTLITRFTPYTFSFDALDTFLVKNLSDSMFVLQQLSTFDNNGHPYQEDTLRKIVP